MGFLNFFHYYHGGPLAIGSIANIAGAVAFRLVLSKRAPGLQRRVAVCLLAGVLGGSIAVAESIVVVEVLDLIQEAAGFALFFLSIFFAPTAVAALTWVLDDSSSGHGKRSGWVLLGAVAGAAVSVPVVLFFLGHLTPLTRALWGSYLLELSRFVAGSVLGLPIALAATLGSAIAGRLSGAATAPVGRLPPS